MLNPKTGQNDGISSAYRLKVASAYVVDPDKPMDIPKLAVGRIAQGRFRGHQANTITGADTAHSAGRCRPAPPKRRAAGESGRLVELPSRGFLPRRPLDRPHYPEGDLDNEGNPVDEKGRRIKTGPSGQQQAGKGPMTLVPKEPYRPISNAVKTRLGSLQQPDRYHGPKRRTRGWRKF